MESIDIREVLRECGVTVGQAEDAVAKTGITVMLAPDGIAAGMDVRGGGPASRDTRVLDPLAAAERIHAIVLGGGSAFGLDAAGGVMDFLEQHDVGLDVGVGGIKVPLVCQSDIFDLGIGSAEVRPDAQMARVACEACWKHEEAGNYRDGSFGAGCGATVGKLLGPQGMQKSGIGSAAVKVGPLMVGAIVVVNALGDVIDPATGAIVAGARGEDGGFADSMQVLAGMYEAAVEQSVAGHAAGAAAADQAAGVAAMASTPDQSAVTNTTIGIIFTNAALSKAQLCKVAGMGHDGMARAIRPVHMSMDGDSLYAVSGGEVQAPLDVVGALAADAVAQAILMAAIMGARS